MLKLYYRQTQSIARPLCDSRATCFIDSHCDNGTSARDIINHYQRKLKKNQFYVLLFATYFRLRPNRLTLSKIGTKISMILY